MSAAYDALVADLRAAASAGVPDADDAADKLEAIASGTDARAIELADSITWIARQDRTLAEKTLAIAKLMNADREMPPGTTFMMKAFLGW